MGNSDYIAGIGPLEPDLMIIGEAPGKYEVQYGRPFVGPSGELLDEALRKAGISRQEASSGQQL
jgi:DNA polymerase